MDSVVYEEKKGIASSSVRTHRKKRRRKTVVGLVPRYILTALVSGVIIFVCYKVVVQIAQPYALQHQQSAQIRSLQSQLASDLTTNQDIDRQIAFVQRPEGVETAARGQGFLKPGEVSLEIDVKAPPTQSDPAHQGFRGMIRRAISHWTGH